MNEGLSAEVKLSTMASATARHGPTPSGSLVVIVRVTLPAVVSADDGM